MKRTLIFGARGGLGQTFQNLLKGRCDVEGHDRQSCDVTSVSQVQKVIESFRPDTVINCSGYTAVDKAETEPLKAMAVNCEAVETLVKYAAVYDFKLVHFSTDYVFDGAEKHPYNETSPTSPVNIYGQSKLQGDLAVLKNDKDLLVRTSWLYSEFGKSFPEKILAKAIAGEKITVVSDQVSAPTYALDLAQATLDLLQKNKSGLFNYSCDGQASWYELATETLSLFNKIKGTTFSPPLPIKTDDLKLAATRPKFTLLDLTKARSSGIIIRPWQKAIEHYINNLIELKFD